MEVPEGELEEFMYVAREVCETKTGKHPSPLLRQPPSPAARYATLRRPSPSRLARRPWSAEPQLGYLPSDIDTWLGKCGRASLRFDYRIFRAETHLTDASVALACVELPHGKLRSLPELLLVACR